MLVRPCCFFPAITALVFFVGCQSSQRNTTRANNPISPGTMAYSGPPSRQFDSPPRFISGLAPIYPITQLRQYKSGRAIISFTIDEQGKTRDFKVISTDYPYYASHAILAVQHWQFEPARKNGHLVAVRVRVPFHYQSPSPPQSTPF
jgi:TonB family protein